MGAELLCGVLLVGQPVGRLRHEHFAGNWSDAGAAADRHRSVVLLGQKVDRLGGDGNRTAGNSGNAADFGAVSSGVGFAVAVCGHVRHDRSRLRSGGERAAEKQRLRERRNRLCTTFPEKGVWFCGTARLFL